MIFLLLLSVINLASTPGSDRTRSVPLAPGTAHLMIFVTSDCPISNYYAPEIQEVCAGYRAKGLTCTLVYEDVGVDEERMRAHLAEYGYRGIAAVIDRDRAIARRAGATVTPQAVLSGQDGRIRYRGRIDNRYEAFGEPRRVVTERNLRDAIDAVLGGKPVRKPETPALGCHIVSPDFKGNAHETHHRHAAGRSRRGAAGLATRLASVAAGVQRDHRADRVRQLRLLPSDG